MVLIEGGMGWVGGMQGGMVEVRAMLEWGMPGEHIMEVMRRIVETLVEMEAGSLMAVVVGEALVMAVGSEEEMGVEVALAAVVVMEVEVAAVDVEAGLKWEVCGQLSISAYE